MSRNPFGHVDLRVRDMDACLPFYSELLSALGFSRSFHGEEWNVFAAEGSFPEVAFFAITEDPGHRPNANRIAFWVGSRDEVDAMGDLLEELDATVESGPRDCPEYSEGYYAVFFQDPSGNELEVVYRTR